jgi:hypothetical protein
LDAHRIKSDSIQSLVSTCCSVDTSTLATANGIMTVFCVVDKRKTKGRFQLFLPNLSEENFS